MLPILDRLVEMRLTNFAKYVSNVQSICGPRQKCNRVLLRGEASRPHAPGQPGSQQELIAAPFSSFKIECSDAI